ncbi:MAG TPA: DUF2460 domain-containing protein [Stellaceae bacterium]|nr:DUF2460 domain-containing protein [Stellaceae bacterium]
MTAIFPTLPGLGWSVSKAPRFATRIQRAVSGRELRALDQPNPLWTWTLTYSILRDQNDTRAASGPGVGYDELRMLMGFFLQQQGAFQPFLFDDPTDDHASAQAIGTGDGGTTVFQLVRTMGAALPGGGFAEPITAPNAVATIYFDGVRQSSSGYSVDPATGLVGFASPPPAGQFVTADFTYYFRARFADDTADFENFLYQLWALKQVKLQSVFV